MKIRDLVEAVVDADVECGADALVMVDLPGRPPLQLLAVDIEEGESFEGARGFGPTIWLRAEEI